jgi:hypothetical protein
MARASELASGPVGVDRSASGRGSWLFSWPLLMGGFAYIFALCLGRQLLMDGDTYWHIATGEWIFQHGSIPTADPFSHTMPGAAWTAHEWLSQVVLAAAHRAGGWTAVVTITALAFAATIALLTRALLKSLEPIYALLFGALAVCMTASHLLARPHMLALPLLMLWTIELVRASEAGRAPGIWLLPLMTLWANLHGGFTLGIALAFAFALEAVLAARAHQRAAGVARSWGIFLLLAVACALVTPHGMQGILFTWQVLFQDSHSYALQRIGEWRSPNFQTMQPLEVWLLGGLALVLHQGLRLPAIRLLLLLGLIHLSLKHIRNVELVGLLVPLFVASPFSAQWRQRQQGTQQLERADRLFRKLAQPAGQGALLVSMVALLALPPWLSRVRPLELPDYSAPVAAVAAARKAGITGPVLNNYGWGGYLIYCGIAPFIDGRSDVYRDAFMKDYVAAMELQTSGSLEKLLDQYKVTWTLLPPDSSAVALLDHLPKWRRVYADKTAVVHAKSTN